LQSAYFDRDDVALHGFSHFFHEQSEEENGHAKQLIKYQNMRGGRVVFQDVPKPATEDWKTALEAVQAALELEKKVNAVI
jgi:ferritin heavy chain